MKKLITILSLILFATIVTAQDTCTECVEWAKRMSKISLAEGGPDFHSLIVKQANEDWGTDYVMVAHVIKSQCKAMYEYGNMKKPVGMTEKTFENIKLDAMDNWTEWNSAGKLIEADWTMVLHVTKRQVKAYLEIF